MFKPFLKIFVCAVTITALFLCSLLSAFAVDYITVGDFSSNGASTPYGYLDMSAEAGGYVSTTFSNLTNKNLGIFNFSSYISSSLVDYGNTYPWVIEPFYTISAPYNHLGTIHVTKNLPFTTDFISNNQGGKILKLSAVVTVGFQKLSTGTPTIHPDSFFIGFGDFVSSPATYELVDTSVVNYSTTDGDIPFQLTTYKISLDVSSGEYFINGVHPGNSSFTEYINSISTSASFYFNGLPQYYVRLFVASSRVVMDYVPPSNLDSYYQGQTVDKNNTTIGGIETSLGNINNSLDVSKPNDDVVSSIGSNLHSSQINNFTNRYGFMNNITDKNFISFISALMLSSVGVAFIGYALHGKRG